MTFDGEKKTPPALSSGGTHILIDLWGAKNLDDPAIAEDAIRKAIRAANATLLHLHVHEFCPGQGVSAIALLAESHITLHTWPEKSYAAADVFVCGNSDPASAVSVLVEAFQPEQPDVRRFRRGDSIKPKR
ncbi:MULTISPECIES: adenosylmethionine decarboxylase [unclassified Bradyrhizobium]|uniref:adenosylmethionine decarboxylase n=1 Tax=unclassified Bradyrhizobium TaxID=2631580 RepID=UPI0020B1BBF9|nr:MULTISPECIES: adenosylmethionine decarboxylase [unclassified Bradyrhizobium]MCP3380446.1 adenosylmethionine decarboxylase [Bradyrhizobium sp. CCGUVB4N]MCP3441317.1 adenosylmethionine decarboxylase [Bradyrhizobium sp. CCGUVB14]